MSAMGKLRLPITLPKPGRKHRVHTWIDTTTLEPRYGVQCNVTKGLWAHVVVDGQMFLCQTEDEAKKAAKGWSVA
jgi:hypothetical protein